MPLAEVERKAYSVAEIARMLGVARNTVYAAIDRGEIPSLRVGSRVIVPKAAFDEWFRSVRAGGSTEAKDRAVEDDWLEADREVGA